MRTRLGFAGRRPARVGHRRCVHRKHPAAERRPLLKLAEPWPADEVVQAARTAADSRRLFRDIEPLTFTLTADFSAINKERNPDNKKLFPAVITVDDAKGPQDIAVKIGSRGHFRLMARNCDFVPIRMEFPRGGETAGTIFEGQTR